MVAPLSYPPGQHPLIRARDLAAGIQSGSGHVPLLQALALLSIADELNALRRTLDQLTLPVTSDDALELNTHPRKVFGDL